MRPNAVFFCAGEPATWKTSPKIAFSPSPPAMPVQAQASSSPTRICSSTPQPLPPYSLGMVMLVTPTSRALAATSIGKLASRSHCAATRQDLPARELPRRVLDQLLLVAQFEVHLNLFFDLRFWIPGSATRPRNDEVSFVTNPVRRC